MFTFELSSKLAKAHFCSNGFKWYPIEIIGLAVKLAVKRQKVSCLSLDNRGETYNYSYFLLCKTGCFDSASICCLASGNSPTISQCGSTISFAVRQYTVFARNWKQVWSGFSSCVAFKPTVSLLLLHPSFAVHIYGCSWFSFSFAVSVDSSVLRLVFKWQTIILGNRLALSWERGP